MKRTFALLAAAALVLGGGAAAFAATTNKDGTPVDREARKAARACVQKAGEDHADDKAAFRAAAKECRAAAGFDPAKRRHARQAMRDAKSRLNPEQREALKACAEAARADHKGDRAGRREAVKACLADAGITRPTPAP
ncbi:MAG: hypothetical protein ACR2HY_00185 [Acidimicrobiales bacterium]